MPMTVDQLPEHDREALLRRLKRVEGQVRGLRAAIEEGGDCHRILTQFTATANALRSAGLSLAVGAFESCLVDGSADADELRRALLGLT